MIDPNDTEALARFKPNPCPICSTMPEMYHALERPDDDAPWARHACEECGRPFWSLD